VSCSHYFTAFCLDDLCVVCVQYKTLEVPYPKDKNKVKELVDAEEKEAVGMHNIHSLIDCNFDLIDCNFLYRGCVLETCSTCTDPPCSHYRSSVNDCAVSVYN